MPQIGALTGEGARAQLPLTAFGSPESAPRREIPLRARDKSPPSLHEVVWEASLGGGN